MDPKTLQIVYNQINKLILACNGTKNQNDRIETLRILKSNLSDLEQYRNEARILDLLSSERFENE